MHSFKLDRGLISGMAFSLLLLPIMGTAATIHVYPGQSIQAAVNKAAPGDTVLVHDGIYQEAGTAYCAPWVDGYPSACGTARTAAVLVNKPLALRASGNVRLIGSGASGLTDGIVVMGPGPNPKNPKQPSTISGVEVKGFNLDNFARNGIVLGYVTNFNVEENSVSNMQEVGIWPMLSANGQVKKNIAYGTKDSALWVEASENIRVVNNDLSAAPTGLEVTISKNIVMESNKIHDNTTGIGLYHPAGAGLPQAYWPKFKYGNWIAVNNNVYENNMPNPVNDGGYVGQIPSGIGMLVMGVSDIALSANKISKNNFLGIGIMDWCVGQVMAASSFGISLSYADCVASLPDGFKDATVKSVSVTHNLFGNNGSTPQLPGIPGVDLLYVGADALGGPAGTNNCQSKNKNSGSNTKPSIVAMPATGLAECKGWNR